MSGVDLGAATASGLVTGDAGTYCHLTVDLGAVSLTPYSEVESAKLSSTSGDIEASADSVTLDPTLVESGQQQAAKWVVEEYLDGPSLGQSADAHSEWLKTSPLIGDSWREAYQQAWDAGSAGGLFMPIPVALQADSRPRVTTVDIAPTLTRVIDGAAAGIFVESCYAVKATYIAADHAQLSADSPETCVTFAVRGNEVPYVVEGTHNSFTVTDRDGAIVAQELSS
ncbi:hypothetical protein AB1K56_14685 [Microbacterium sp. BWR-S6Y]|uniref:hypothetical protein n=1 Tax=Microbacterium sp. BWR-S6Y TaxID=3232073 RepID=UPI0035291C0B